MTCLVTKFGESTVYGDIDAKAIAKIIAPRVAKEILEQMQKEEQSTEDSTLKERGERIE